ncbi:hypothetical protein LGH70_19675 [Hymenobacter sp. BT635]|uniref:Uncharacterized protein n=1 Tax=Hymenobacter nitidus TaxID=2880929 RepID=A0ABS8AHC1_9BACT|nr:hypothetical protein [Hymenobacter nitidus]MCB2379826.1 hypothetical protein [Hymenobacter nitidus]
MSTKITDLSRNRTLPTNQRAGNKLLLLSALCRIADAAEALVVEVKRLNTPVPTVKPKAPARKKKPTSTQ